MRRISTILVGVLALAGCGRSYTPPPAQEPGPVPPPQESEDAMTMSGVDLYHHDPRPTGGVARKPTFWLHANTFSVLDDNTWAVEDAHAVIFEKDSEKELIVLDAKRGRFEQDKNAYLRDGVTARAGAMLMKLEDIEWRNRAQDTPSEASSQHPVSIDSPELQLQAATVRLYPDTHEFELTDVVGTVHFRRNQS